MQTTHILGLAAEALKLALLLSAPALGICFALGTVAGFFQGLLQLQDAALSFTAKLCGLVVVFVFLGGWMFQSLIHFTSQLWAVWPP